MGSYILLRDREVDFADSTNCIVEQNRFEIESELAKRLSNSKLDGAGNGAKAADVKQRLKSLDVFRGLTVALMILVDDAGGVLPTINHSPWNGVTIADFVMPFFLFIVGVALALVYKRIAIGYFVAAMCEIWLTSNSLVDSFPGFAKKYCIQWVVAVLLSTLYVGCLYGLYVPDWQFEVPAINFHGTSLNNGSAVQTVFFYEDILDLKWMFFIHYDPILRHVFDDALVDTEKNNDGQQNEREGLQNIEEIDIHDDAGDGYVQAQEDNNPELDNVMKANNMDGVENDDPNTSGNNMDGLKSNFNDDEYDAGQDEDDDNINYLKDHMNIDNDTLDDIVADNNVNDQDF